MKRRSFLSLSAAIMPAVLPSKMAMPPLVLSQSRPLTVSAFGGVFQEAFTSYVANKFTEETGISVNVVSQSLDDTWVFGIANAVRNGLTPVDLTILTRSQIIRLERIGGMLQPFSKASLKNLTGFRTNTSTKVMAALPYWDNGLVYQSRNQYLSNSGSAGCFLERSF